MKPLTLIEKIKNVTPYNVRNFVEGTFNSLMEQKAFNVKGQAHINEQALYRASLCNDCSNNGACLYCNCKTPEMFFAPNKYDSKGKWGVMMNKEDWSLFKLVNGKNFKCDNMHYSDTSKEGVFIISGSHDYIIDSPLYMFINFMKVNSPIVIQNTFSVIVKASMTKDEFNKHVENLEGLDNNYHSGVAGNSQESSNNISNALLFESEVVDFGTISEGINVLVRFSVYNKSVHDMTVSNITVGCSCTSSVSKGLIVPSKTKQELLFTFNSTNRRGPNSKTAVVEFTDATGDKYNVTLTFKGLVI